jgi:hypothetical protein
VKAPRFSTDNGNACGYHYILGAVVVGILFMTRFRVKTLARLWAWWQSIMSLHYRASSTLASGCNMLDSSFCMNLNRLRHRAVLLTFYISSTRVLGGTVIGMR